MSQGEGGGLQEKKDDGQALLLPTSTTGRRASQEFLDLRRKFEEKPQCYEKESPKSSVSISFTNIMDSKNPGGSSTLLGPFVGGGRKRKYKQLKLSTVSSNTDGKGFVLAVVSTNEKRARTPDSGSGGNDDDYDYYKKRKVMPNGV